MTLQKFDEIFSEACEKVERLFGRKFVFEKDYDWSDGYDDGCRDTLDTIKKIFYKKGDLEL